MNIFERAKIVAEIADLADLADLASRVYGLLVDKSRALCDRDARIKDLEAQLAELRRKIGTP